MVEKKNIDWSSLGFSYQKTDYRFVANFKDGSYVLQISPSDTEGLDVGRYYYDVGLQIGGEYYMVIEQSLFTVLQNISETIPKH